MVAAQMQGERTMGIGRNELEEARAHIASLERQRRSRDDYIVGLTERNRMLRVEVKKHEVEVLRLRQVLRQAGLTDAVRDSSTRLAAALTSLDADAPPPSTPSTPEEKRATRGSE